MCLGVPGRVVSRYELHGQPMGRLDFGGVVKDVCLAYVPEIAIGQYAIVHVGFAISVIDEASAHETLELYRQMGTLEEALGEPPGEAS
jgi:hydrogenase expression/formation protein HypC